MILPAYIFGTLGIGSVIAAVLFHVNCPELCQQKLDTIGSPMAGRTLLLFEKIE